MTGEKLSCPLCGAPARHVEEEGRTSHLEWRLPDVIPDNWRRIILDHHNRRAFCPRALYADLRDTPPAYDPPPAGQSKPLYGPRRG